MSVPYTHAGASDAATTAPMSQGDGNPFLPLSFFWRVLIIAFLAVYYFAVPALREAIAPSPTPLAGVRLAAEWVYYALLFMPLFFYRREWGWLHPLLFPSLFNLAKGIVTAPESLLAPFLMLGTPREMTMSHTALAGWSEEAIATADLKATLIRVLAVVAYYAGFFLGPRLRLPALSFPRPTAVRRKAATIVAFSVAVFVIFLDLRGGLEAHIISWAGGRNESLSGLGPVIVAVRLAVGAMLLWYALDRNAAWNPIFIFSSVFAAFAVFFVNGSRSSVLFAFIMFLLIWMIRHKKVPRLRILTMAVAGVVLLGLLGDIRRSGWSGDSVDWSLVLQPDVEGAVYAARAELERRSGGYLPVIARAEEVGLRYGETYVGALLFWVPRALWKDKPRGAGGLNGEIIFGKGPGGAGVPTGSVGEAYWNFHLPGVVLIFFMFGTFHLWLARVYKAYAAEAAVWPLYIVTLLYFEPQTATFTNFLHYFIPMVAMAVWMNALQFGRRSGALAGPQVPVGTT